MATAKNISDYKNRSMYQFPSENINPELKDAPEYALAFGMAFMSEYASNHCQIPFDFGGEFTFDELRRYAQGKEGESRVKRNFFGESKKDPKTGKYATTINVDWNGIDIMPKFFDVMRAINQGIEYKTTCRAIDAGSIEAKEFDRELLKHLIDGRTKELLEKAKYKPSTPVSLEDIGAETEADIDLYTDSGGYITQREIKSNAVIQKTRKESDNSVLQHMFFDDLTTLAIMAGKNYVDHANKQVLRRYCDVGRCAIPYSKYLDFRNLTRFGEIRTMTIGELREEYSHVSGAQWKKIAKDYAWKNPETDTMIQSSGMGYYNSATSTMYGDMINQSTVEVFDFQWLSNDSNEYLENEKNEVFKEVDYGYEVSERATKRGDKKITKNTIKKRYGSWVIGTDFMLDHGIADGIVYYGKDGNRIPGLDFFVNKTGNKSLVERCIPHVEDIKLAVVKRRNAIATLPPAPRMIIQRALIDNVVLGGIKQKPEDLLVKFKESGVMVVDSLDEFGKPIIPNGKAIEYVTTGLVEDITMFTNEINEGIERIREVTGVNQSVDASTPDKYTGLGKSQMAATAANNALKPTFNCYISFITRADTDVVKKWQWLAKKYPGIKITQGVMGINDIQVFELGEDFINSELDIYTEMEFSEDEKQNLLFRILELNKAYTGSNGAAGLSTAEFMHLESMIMAGSFQFAKFVIARTEKKREIAAARVKRADMEFNSQSQLQSLVQNNKYKLQEITDSERKKLLSNRVLEIEKRITKLYELMDNDHLSPETANDSNAVLTQIQLCKTEIERLINNDMMIDQARVQEEQAMLQGGQAVA